MLYLLKYEVCGKVSCDGKAKTKCCYRLNNHKSKPCCGAVIQWFYAVIITAAQFHLIKHELKFCAGLNSARGVSEICDGENL